MITAVTQKGQGTIPKAFRDQLGIELYGKVAVEVAKDHVKIKPKQDILDMAGTLVPRKNKSKTALDARKAMEKQYKRV